MPRRYVHERYQHKNDAEIATLYQDGLSTYEIGERFGISPNTVTLALRRQNVPRRIGAPQSMWAGTDEQITEVITLYRSGVSVTNIGRRLGCRTTHVTKTLADAGIERKPHGTAARKLTDAQVAETVAEYKAGATTPELAKKYGTTLTTIRNYLRGEGVTLRPYGIRIWDGGPDWRVEAYRRYVAGESQQAIADFFGLHQTTVSDALRARGVLPRHRPARGKDHGSWQGGRTIDGNGYVRVRVPEDARHLITPQGNGYVLEHRLVMARKLGRPLTKNETVHHVDGDRTHNDPGNLQLRQGRHGKGVAVACLDCGSANVGTVPLH